MLRQRAELLRIQWQILLQPQNHISKEAAHETENQHCQGVLLPALLLLRIHAEHAVGEFFQRAQHRVEPGATVGVEHAVEIEAERLGDEHERADVKREFQPLMGVHGSGLKFFRPQHRHKEIHTERDGDDSENEVFHKAPRVSRSRAHTAQRRRRRPPQFRHRRHQA